MRPTCLVGLAFALLVTAGGPAWAQDDDGSSDDGSSDEYNYNYTGDDYATTPDSATATPASSTSRPKPVTFSIELSEAIQYRIPRVDGVPNTASNLAGGGIAATFRWLELSPEAHLIYSFTKVTVDDGITKRSANASGLGWDLGMRIAVGPFEKPGMRYYAFASPQFASWHLEGSFSNSTTFDSDIIEVATEFGAGVNLPVTGGFAVELFATFVHLGFRPFEDEIASVTTYPTVGFSIKARLGGRYFGVGS